MDSHEIEEELAQTLTEGDMKRLDTRDAVRRKMAVRTEVRIRTEMDPVVEETRLYRRLAREVDDRYARYDELVDERDEQASDE